MCIVGGKYRIISVEWWVGLAIHFGVAILLLISSLWIPPQCWEPSIGNELYDDRLMNQYDHISLSMVQKVWSYSTKWRTARAFTKLIIFFGLMIEVIPTNSNKLGCLPSVRIDVWAMQSILELAFPFLAYFLFFLPSLRISGWAMHSILELPFPFLAFFLFSSPSIQIGGWAMQSIQELPFPCESGKTREALSSSLLCIRAHNWGYPY